MSDFVFVIPEGWIQLDWQYITNNVAGMGYSAVAGGLASDIEAILKSEGIITQESTLLEFKLFNDEVFIIKLG